MAKKNKNNNIDSMYEDIISNGLGESFPRPGDIDGDGDPDQLFQSYMPQVFSEKSDVEPENTNFIQKKQGGFNINININSKGTRSKAPVKPIVEREGFSFGGIELPDKSYSLMDLLDTDQTNISFAKEGDKVGRVKSGWKGTKELQPKQIVIVHKSANGKKFGMKKKEKEKKKTFSDKITERAAKGTQQLGTKLGKHTAIGGKKFLKMLKRNKKPPVTFVPTEEEKNS